MKKYEIGMGIFDSCFNFNSLVIEAENREEALKIFFDNIIEEIKDLDYEKIAKTDDGWINEEIKR